MTDSGFHPGGPTSPGQDRRHTTHNHQSPTHNGTGDQYVHYSVAERENYFASGEKSLELKQYPRVVSAFETYLSTYNEDEDPEDRETLIKQAKAYTYIALGLLNGDPPRNRLPEEIYRIGHQLDMAMGRAKLAGGADPVLALAGALWRIVEEDYYKSARMPAPELESGDGPSPDVVDHLDETDVAVLAKHTPAIETPTRKAVAARSVGVVPYDPEAAARQMQPVQDPQRAEKVRKYFTRTPTKVEPTAHIVAFCAAAGLAVLGFVVGGAAIVLFLAAAIWPLRIGLRKYKIYQAYLRAYAAAEPKPTDAQMDEWLRQDMDYIVRRAPDELHINTGLQTEGRGGQLIFPAQKIVSVYETTAANDRTWVAYGKDGQLRATRYEVLILFLTDKYITTYGGLLDFFTGNLVIAAQHEYHYRDIVQFSSVSVPMDRSIEQLVQFVFNETDVTPAISYRQQFTLTLAAGDPVRMTIGYNGPTVTSSGEVAWAENAHALPIIQRMVRARKTAPVS